MYFYFKHKPSEKFGELRTLAHRSFLLLTLSMVLGTAMELFLDTFRVLELIAIKEIVNTPEVERNLEWFNEHASQIRGITNAVTLLSYLAWNIAIMLVIGRWLLILFQKDHERFVSTLDPSFFEESFLKFKLFVNKSLLTIFVLLTVITATLSILYLAQLPMGLYLPILVYQGLVMDSVVFFGIAYILNRVYHSNIAFIKKYEKAIKENRIKRIMELNQGIKLHGIVVVQFFPIDLLANIGSYNFQNWMRDQDWSNDLAALR